MVNELLRGLLEASVYSGIIFAAVMLLKKTLGARMSPVLHLALWVVLIVRLCVPVTFDAGVHFFTVESSAGQEVVERQAMDRAAEPAREDAPEETGYTPVATGGNAAGAAEEYWMEKPVVREDADAEAVSASAVKIGAGQVVLMVWMAGAGGYLAAVGVGTARLKKRLRKRLVRTPDFVCGVLDECRERLGIRREVRVQAVRGLATPALTVSFAPKILLPAGLVNGGSRNALRFALLHELTHYKRRDYALCMLLHVLQAVYWFNPFLWLAQRQMRLDLEGACDAAVVRRMDTDGKAAYAQSILSLSVPRGSGYVLGMALDGAGTVKRRIRGIFAERKSSPGAKLAAVLAVVALVVCCFTTACQPVEEPAVRTEETAETMAVLPEGTEVKAEKTAASEQETAGQTENASRDTGGSMTQPMRPDAVTAQLTHWEEKESSADGRITVSVNADVVVPARDTAVTYLVDVGSRPELSEMEQMAAAFFGEDTGKMGFVAEGPVVAEDISDTIDSYEAAIGDIEEGTFAEQELYGGEDTPEARAELIAYYRSMIAFHEEQLEHISSETGETTLEKTVPFDWRLRSPTHGASGKLMRDDGAEANISVHLSNDGYMFFNKDTYKRYLSRQEIGAGDAAALEAAGQAARELLEEMGLGRYEVGRTGAEGYSGEIFRLKMERMVDGIPAPEVLLGDSPGWLTDDSAIGDPEYPGFVNCEIMQLTVDESGVVAFVSQDRYEILQAQGEGGLLPFETVQRRITEQLMEDEARVMAYHESNGTTYDYVNFEIERVRLEYVLQPVKGSNLQLLVPVWNAYGPRSYGGDFGGEDQEVAYGPEDDRTEYQPLMSIDAVTGEPVYNAH